MTTTYINCRCSAFPAVMTLMTYKKKPRGDDLERRRRFRLMDASSRKLVVAANTETIGTLDDSRLCVRTVKDLNIQNIQGLDDRDQLNDGTRS